jgi:hypothetical protein
MRPAGARLALQRVLRQSRLRSAPWRADGRRISVRPPVFGGRTRLRTKKVRSIPRLAWAGPIATACLEGGGPHRGRRAGRGGWVGSGEFGPMWEGFHRGRPGGAWGSGGYGEFGPSWQAVANLRRAGQVATSPRCCGDVALRGTGGIATAGHVAADGHVGSTRCCRRNVAPRLRSHVAGAVRLLPPDDRVDPDRRPAGTLTGHKTAKRAGGRAVWGVSALGSAVAVRWPVLCTGQRAPTRAHPPNPVRFGAFRGFANWERLGRSCDDADLVPVTEADSLRQLLGGGTHHGRPGRGPVITRAAISGQPWRRRRPAPRRRRTSSRLSTAVAPRVNASSRRSAGTS